MGWLRVEESWQFTASRHTVNRTGKPLLPMTSLVTDTALVLPLFYEMSEEEQDYVIECLGQVGR